MTPKPDLSVHATPPTPEDFSPAVAAAEVEMEPPAADIVEETDALPALLSDEQPEEPPKKRRTRRGGSSTRQRRPRKDKGQS